MHSIDCIELHTTFPAKVSSKGVQNGVGWGEGDGGGGRCVGGGKYKAKRGRDREGWAGGVRVSQVGWGRGKL